MFAALGAICAARSLQQVIAFRELVIAMESTL
jgi:hypothetical protein